MGAFRRVERPRYARSMGMRQLLSASIAAAAFALGGTAFADGLASVEVPSPDGEPRTDVALIHSLGVMTVMRTAEAALYPMPFADFSPASWVDAYGRALSQPPKWDGTLPPFEWDGDPWTINVLGHGLFGSELYLRARLCHHDAFSALVFAAATSATWEYVFEANGVQPSGFDLWYTPAAGLIVGELRHLGWRAASTVTNPALRGVLTFVLDPLGTVERSLGAPC